MTPGRRDERGVGFRARGHVGDGLLAVLGEDAVEEHRELDESAYRGIGTLAEIRDHILRLRDALGITYFCLRGPDVEKLGSIARELSGRT